MCFFMEGQLFEQVLLYIMSSDFLAIFLSSTLILIHNQKDLETVDYFAQIFAVFGDSALSRTEKNLWLIQGENARMYRDWKDSLHRWTLFLVGVSKKYPFLIMYIAFSIQFFLRYKAFLAFFGSHLQCCRVGADLFLG